jgi:hypothetical protein
LNSVNAPADQNQQNRTEDNSNERFPSKPLSSHGVGMSVQMLQQRRQQSIEFQNNGIQSFQMSD